MRDPEQRLLAILAHPDDESLGNGGMLAKCAEEGVATYLLTATRGERGWFGPPDEYPGPRELGRIRERELRAAAKRLGIREVVLLDYVDGELDRAEPGVVVAALVREIRRLRPQVVVTFDPWGLYGHPDHIAVSRFATEAVTASARSEYRDGAPPHLVDGLYYMAWTQPSIELYSQAFGEIELRIGDEVRCPHPWPD